MVFDFLEIFTTDPFEVWEVNQSITLEVYCSVLREQLSQTASDS